MKIILGSQSQGRQKLLRDAGIDFDDVVAADIDEKAIRSDDCEELPRLLAMAKARALAAKLGDKDALLITADSVVTYGGELREKPASIEQAREYLRTYEPNKPAWVNTGVVVTNLETGKQASGFDKAAVCFERISEEDIEKIITDGICMHCAGGFASEHPLFTPYLVKIDGAPDAVIGLPLELTKHLLQEAARS